jgi:hypothetical protein
MRSWSGPSSNGAFGSWRVRGAYFGLALDAAFSDFE